MHTSTATAQLTADEPNGLHLATTPPAIHLSPEDQQRLTTVYAQWQQASQTAEMGRLQFNATLYQIMAEARMSPKEYQAKWENGAFTFTRIEGESDLKPKVVSG